jgi:hypothetical protein
MKLKNKILIILLLFISIFLLANNKIYATDESEYTDITFSDGSTYSFPNSFLGYYGKELASYSSYFDDDHYWYVFKFINSNNITWFSLVSVSKSIIDEGGYLKYSVDSYDYYLVTVYDYNNSRCAFNVVSYYLDNDSIVGKGSTSVSAGLAGCELFKTSFGDLSDLPYYAPTSFYYNDEVFR